MDDPWLVLAGGAIGTVLVAVGWATLRLWAVPGDVARHDEQARVRNEDLELWVADEHRDLRQRLNAVTNDMAARGLLWSGIHGAQRAEEKTRKLHRYRDRLHEAERELAELQATENWAHTVWRRWRDLPPLRLTAPAALEPVLDEWRADVTRHAERAKIHDPTRWKLDDLLREIREKPLEPAEPPTPAPVQDLDDLGEEKQRPSGAS